MAENKVNWNTVLVVLVIGVVGILLLSNSSLTGMQIFKLKQGVKANSCDADGTCEMINARVGSIGIQSSPDFDSISNSVAKQEDKLLIITAAHGLNLGGSPLRITSLMTKREKGVAYVCVNKEDGEIFSSNIACDRAKLPK